MERSIPKLCPILQNRPKARLGNRIAHNICVGGKWLDLADGLTDQVVKLEANLVDGEPNLVAPRDGDFRLREGSPALKAGFKPLPMPSVGLYESNDQNKSPRK